LRFRVPCIRIRVIGNQQKSDPQAKNDLLGSLSNNSIELRSKVKRRAFIFVCILCLLLQSDFAVAQILSPDTFPREIKNELDLIHSADIIDVDFAGGLEYDWRGHLTSDGMLDGVSEFSPIPALCRSEIDVAADIARAYSKVLREPQVTVKIVDRSNRPPAMLNGAVKVPTRFRIKRPVRLRELIVVAGGLTDDANGAIVVLRRPDQNCAAQDVSATTESGSEGKLQPDNGLQKLNISIADLLSGKESANPFVLGSDTVTVEKAVPIYIIGAVNNPKPIFSRSGMTLTRAIATAGGLAERAAGQKVTIYRREKGETGVMQADLEKIKNGEISDVDLKAFDIIEVAFKGRAPRKYPPVIAAGEDRRGNASELPLRVID
jgi:protein involved in polysaccharide export with SLBB domain